jgi:hypothetical protein
MHGMASAAAECGDSVPRVSCQEMLEAACMVTYIWLHIMVDLSWLLAIMFGCATALERLVYVVRVMFTVLYHTGSVAYTSSLLAVTGY